MESLDSSICRVRAIPHEQPSSPKSKLLLSASLCEDGRLLADGHLDCPVAWGIEFRRVDVVKFDYL
jgi:hypothetical protein